MTRPTTFDRQSSFALYTAENPGEPHTGQDLDIEFNAVKIALDETQDVLAGITDADGELARGSVGQAQLASDLVIGIAAPSVWATATAYIEDESVVFNDAVLYICAVSHTSGTFSADLTAGKWVELADFSATHAIADLGITTAKIANGAVTAAKLGTSAVETAKINSGAVTAVKLATDSVETAKIVDLNVTAAKLAADAVETAKILDLNVTSAKLAADAVTAIKLADSALAYGAVMLNGTIAESRTGGATTIAIKTMAGTDPSATDPVYFAFRSATAGSGLYTIRSVTAALSIVVPSTATMGFTSATAGRLWLLAIDNAGTVELAVINCRNGINIYPLQGWGIVSTTVINTSSDSAAVPYSTTARTDVPYVTLGYLTWETGLTTAGTWDAAPTRVQLFGPGVKLPGDRVQVQRNVVSSAVQVSTVLPNDDTIPQNTEGGEVMTQAITPTSAANLLEVSADLRFYNSGTVFSSVAVFRDSVAAALAAATQYTSLTEQNNLNIRHVVLAGDTAATTLKVRLGPSTSANLTLNGFADNTRGMGGVSASNLWVEETVG